VIGPGGKVIQEIQKSTGAKLSIEEEPTTAFVEIFAPDKDALGKAKEMIRQITVSPEIDEVYEGTVTSIMPFGAFVEILPGKEGLLHISELAWERVNKTEDVLNVGDKIQVKLIKKDKITGKLALSMKVLIPKPAVEKSPG